MNRRPDHKRPTGILGYPGAFGSLLHADRLTTGTRLYRDDMTREFPKEIAARNPGRKREGLTRRGIFDPAFDDKMMPIGIGKLDGVVNQWAFLFMPIEISQLNGVIDQSAFLS